MRIRKNEMTILLVIIIAFALIVSIPLVSNNAKPSGSGLGGKQPDIGFQTSGVPSYNGFLFPYVYQQPSVPKTVGVQGISGPNVPLSDIGVTQQAGTSGHLGPVNITDPLNTTMAGPSSSVSIQIFNQTLQPSSSAYDIGATVSLQNISLYKFYTGHTDNHGFANFTLTEGWYYLAVGQSGSHMGFSQEIYIGSSVFSITRYAMPTSSSNVQSIGNGASGSLKSGSLYTYSASGFPATGVSISVHNGSKTGSLIFSGITNSMGFLNYTGLSGLYSYYYIVDGYEQPSTGTILGYTNASGSFSSGSLLSIALYGKTSWTASVSGTPPSQGYVNSISFSTPVTFTGGQVYLSAPLTSPNYDLKFVNTRVYFNSSVTYSLTSNISPNMFFINSTIVMLSNQNLFGSIGSVMTNAAFNNSVVFFSTLDNSAIPYTTKGQIVGPFLVGTARNSIFEGVHNAVTNSAVISGSYSNTEFYRFNMTESNPPNPSPTGSITHFDHVFLLDSNLVISQLYVDNSILNRIGYVNVGLGLTINQSYVDFHLWNGETGLTLGTVVLTHDTIRPYAPTDGNGNALLNPSYLNVSYTFINATPRGPGLNWYSLTFSAGHSSYYNDYLIDYPSISIRRADIAMISSSYSGWGSISFHDTFMNMSYTQLYGMDSMSFSPPHYFDLNFSHTNFSNGWSDQEWNPFEWFAGVVSPLTSKGAFNNCTFYGIHYDPAIWWKQYNASTDVNIAFWQDMNVPSPPNSVWGRIYTNFSSIYNVGIGTNLPHSFGAMEGGIATYFDHNVFYNDPHAVITSVGTTGWYNGSYFQVPLAANIGHSAGHLYMTNNWFLNLTNQTVPTEGISWNGGQGTNVTITMSNNHFYYYPNKLQTYIPTYTTPPAVPFDNNTRYTWPTGQSHVTHANYSFEIPMNKWGVFTSPAYQSQYVFNSTVLQQSPVNLHPNSVYAYIIEPDVNTSTGRPVVSFANGLVGGIQPNFTWNGSNYQLAVEQNMTLVSAQSVSAAVVGLQFQVPVGLGIVDVWMYNSSTGKNQLIKSVQESGTQSTVTVNYNPSTMPLTAVFFTNTSAGFNVTFRENGLPAGNYWSVSLDGVLSTSSSGNITFEVGSGSYSYLVSQLVGFASRPARGNITVSNSSLVVGIAWSSVDYPIKFVETGLSGENWTVTLSGFSSTTNSSTIVFQRQNGTYEYSIEGPASYQTNNSAGNVTIDGAGQLLQVPFTYSNSSQVGTQPPPSPPVPPPNPPTSTTQPPPSGAGPGGTSYRTLVIQLVAVALVPSVILTFYMSLYLVKESRTKSEPKKKLVVKYKKIR